MKILATRCHSPNKYRTQNRYYGETLHYLQNTSPFLPPLKILMTTDTLSEVWIYSLELARALGRKGHQVVLATMGRPLTSQQRDQVKHIPGLDVFESNFKVEWMDDPWPEVKEAGQWLLCLERQVQPDLIHLNSYAHAILPWRAPKLVVGHSCMLSWWNAVKKQPAPQTWRLYQQYTQRGLQAADLVLAPTQATLTALEYHYGPLPRSRVVPYGFQPDLLRIDKKLPFVFATSRAWDEAENITALDSIAPLLPWPIYVAGQDRYPSHSSHSLEHVNLLDEMTSGEMLPWFASAPIYTLPARYEPFGFSPLKAARSGCALVLGDIPSLRETWGDAALYVPPDDPAALEVALTLLIVDSTYRKMMARRAHTRAQKLTADRMVAAYLYAYGELVKSPQVVL